MKPIPLVRATAPSAFVGLLSEAGAPVERLWEAAGLPPAALHEPDKLVPVHFMIRFTENAAAYLDRPDLGLRVAHREGLASAGRFGAAIRGAPTLLRAIETARDFVGTYNSAGRYWIVPEGGLVRVCRRVRSTGSGFRQADLLTVGLIVELVRLVAGSDWWPERIELQSTAPVGPTAAWAAGASVETGQPATSITLPRRLLAGSLAPPPAHGMAGARGAVPPQPSDFLSSARLVIGAQLEARGADVAAAAGAAGMSVRSFQRRLATEGASYSGLVDEVRFDLARHLLVIPEVKIIDVAVALGYADAAHLTRAVRRWTSMSPVEYRRSLLEPRADASVSA